MPEEEKNFKVPAFMRRSKRRTSLLAQKETGPKKRRPKSQKKISRKRTAHKKKKASVKKVFVKKKNLPAKKKEAKKKIIGSVTHYFDNIKVAIIKFSQPIGVGEMIGFEEKKPFLQKITSIQLEHKNIQKAPKGKEVGIKVKKPVSVGCKLIMG